MILASLLEAVNKDKIQWSVLNKKDLSKKDIDEIIKIAKRYGFTIKGIIDEIPGLGGPFIDYEHKKMKLKGKSSPDNLQKILKKIKIQKAFYYWRKEMERYIQDNEFMSEKEAENIKKNYKKALEAFRKLFPKKKIRNTYEDYLD